MSQGAPSGSAPSSTAETLAIGGAVAVCAVGVVLFGGAWLSSRPHGRVSGDAGALWTVAGRLLTAPGDPAAAWGDHASGLPGPVGYWSATLFVAVVVTAIGWLGFRGWRRLRDQQLERLGVGTSARVARPSDLRTLTVPSVVPPPGRFLLGRASSRGPLLATEDRDRHALRGAAGRRQGTRGSVALIGPTQSGKTVTLSTGIAGWDGPVVALSVKRDLYDVTASARAAMGELAVFDPGESTSLATARWTPLRRVTTTSGAMRAGRALAAAIPRNGVSGGDYWAQQGETFVSAYMALAGLSLLLPDSHRHTGDEPLTIQRLTAWAFRGAGITDPAINDLVRMGLQSSDLETHKLAEAAGMKLLALHLEDPKIRASIYATARMAFEAWSEPSVEHSASRSARAKYHSDVVWDHKPRFIDLEWLMGAENDGKANTLYLIAPDTEFKRLAPVLGGLLGDLREQIHAWDIEGRRLTKPLLFVIDEAAQLELQWLPEEVSTIAGLGGMFVTCWQSKAQIDHRYGTLSDAVLGGHRSKVIFTGCDDPATLNWLGKVTGTEHVARRSWSADTTGGRRTVSESVQREDLVAAHVVRQMLPGEAVLIHGTLPPVHLQSVPWWQDRTMRQVTGVGEDGRPVLPDVSTCPLSTERAPRGGEPGMDQAVREESEAYLPRSKGPDGLPSTQAGGSGRAPRSRVVPARPRGVKGQQRLPTESTPTAPTRTVQQVECAGCNAWVAESDGAWSDYDLAPIFVCFTCRGDHD